MDLEGAEDRLALQAPAAQLPVLLVCGDLRRSRVRRRPRQDAARARPEHRQGAVDVHDPRPDRFLAGRSSAAASTSAAATASSTCVDAASGKSVFEFEAGGPLSASPAVAAGELVIGSSRRQAVLPGIAVACRSKLQLHSGPPGSDLIATLRHDSHQRNSAARSANGRRSNAARSSSPARRSRSSARESTRARSGSRA